MKSPPPANREAVGLMPETAEPTQQATELPGASQVAEGDLDDEQLIRSAGRGAAWQLLGGGWQAIVRIGASTVLRRVLTPADFGIVGMAVLASTFVDVISPLGMATGLIAKKDTTEEDNCTVFWTNMAVHVAMFAIAVSAAPLVPMFFRYRRPGELIWVLRAVSLTFLFSGVTTTSRQMLRKRLKFAPLAIVGGARVVVESGLAVVLAVWGGMTYWALVWAMVIATVLSQLAVFAYARWRPRLLFSLAGFRYLFRYGINGMGVWILNYFHYNMDYLIVGRILDATALGLYQCAYQIPHMVLWRLAQPASTVIFPALAQVQHSNYRLMAGYLKSVRYTSLLIFPLLVGLAAVAKPAVLTLWGHQWTPMIPAMQLLCISPAIRCALISLDSIFLCKNRPDIPFKLGMVKLVFTFAVVGLMAWRWGITGVAGGMVISQLPNALGLYLAFRMTKRPMGLLRQALVPPLTSAAVCGGAALAASIAISQTGAPEWVNLIVSTSVGMAGYLAAMMMWFPKTLGEVEQTVRLVMGLR